MNARRESPSAAGPGARVRWAASVGLLVLLLAVAVQQGPRLAAVLRGADLQWLAAGFGFYLVNYGLRGLRFRWLVAGGLNWWPDAVRVAMLHGATAYLLPLRTGDAALPALLRAYAGVDLGAGVRVLVGARLLDLASLGLWVVGAMLALPPALPGGWRFAWLLVGLGLLVSPVLLRAGLRGVSQRWQWLAERHRHWDVPLGKAAWPLFALSAGIWGTIGGCLYAVARAIGLPLGFSDVWFLVSAQLPLQLMPLQGIGNAGNHEVGWVAALGVLGVPPGDALGFALASHVVLLAYVLLLGGIGLLLPRSRR